MPNFSDEVLHEKYVIAVDIEGPEGPSGVPAVPGDRAGDPAGPTQPGEAGAAGEASIGEGAQGGPDGPSSTSGGTDGGTSGTGTDGQGKPEDTMSVTGAAGGSVRAVEVVGGVGSEAGSAAGGPGGTGPRSRSVIMRDKDGRQFNCTIPDASSSSLASARHLAVLVGFAAPSSCGAYDGTVLLGRKTGKRKRGGGPRAEKRQKLVLKYKFYLYFRIILTTKETTTFPLSQTRRIL